MSFISIDNVKISGVSACVPAEVEEVLGLPVFNDEDALNFIKSTGVERRRKSNELTTSADLCLKASETLINDLNWNKQEIDCLIFASQTPDYILPATSAILQDKLGLSTSCYTLDISLGCSGWVYALSVISSLMSHGTIKKGLLLSGDTILKMCSPKDKSTYPLFGDAGTATAIEYSNDKNDRIHFSFNSDGEGYDAIIVKDGGYRNPVTISSFKNEDISEGIERNKLDIALNGMDVFSFGISRAPESVRSLVENYELNLDGVDYFIFHQANKFMNEKIRRKLRLTEEKVPYSLKDFGNTSCASIPLTMVSQMRGDLENKELSHISCGFGVGLSWGSCYFKTNKIICPELIIY